MANLGGETLTITMRPRTFDDIIGLETQVAAIRNKIANGVPRAFLLKGPFGCGKTTLAYIIAKEVQGWEFTGAPQVQEINAGNLRGIDAMRGLCDTASSYPMTGKYSVIILDEAHRLTRDAQELLLKEFESENSPTVWVICTTDPEKLIPGIRAGRCFTQEVAMMDEAAVRKLVARAVTETNHEGLVEDFIQAVLNAQLGSPRKILMAFESYHVGTPAAKACGDQTAAILPEFFDIAFAIVFGQWDKSITLAWAGNKEVRAVGGMLKELDDKLKKKPAASDDTEEEDGKLDEGDVSTKTEYTTGLRCVVAGFLKGQVLPTAAKGKAFKYKAMEKSAQAYKAMHVLANTVPPDNFDIGWPGLVVTLFRVNQIMQGKQ